MIVEYPRGYGVALNGLTEYSKELNKWRARLVVSYIPPNSSFPPHPSHEFVTDELDDRSDAEEQLTVEMDYLSKQLQGSGYDAPITTITDFESGLSGTTSGPAN